MTSYVFNVLVMLTQSLNTITGGHPDQSFSSRSYEAMLRGKRWGHIAVTIIDGIFFPINGAHHCLRAYHADSERTYSDG